MLSIIIPTYNSERYLRPCLLGLLEFGVDDIEIIVVDSFSVDNTLSIVNEFLDQGLPIDIIYAGRGLYKCWNLGLKKAKGEYIYILPSDDSVDAVELRKAMGILASDTKAEAIVSPLGVMNAKGDKSTQSPDFGSEVIYQAKQGDSVTDALLKIWSGGVSSVTSVTQILFKKSIFGKTGFFDTTVGAIGDYFWSGKLLLRCKVIAYPMVFSWWRRHDNQVTGSNKALIESLQLMLRRHQDIQPELERRLPTMPQRYWHEKVLCFKYLIFIHKIKRLKNPLPEAHYFLSRPLRLLSLGRLLLSGSRRPRDIATYLSKYW